MKRLVYLQDHGAIFVSETWSPGFTPRWGGEFVPGGVLEFPLVREPCVEIPRWPRGQVREIELRIDLVPAASCSENCRDSRGAAAAQVAHDERVLAVPHHPFYLAFAVIIYGHGAIGAEDVELGLCAEHAVHHLRHGTFGQQLFFPAQQLLPPFGQQRRR